GSRRPKRTIGSISLADVKSGFTVDIERARRNDNDFPSIYKMFLLPIGSKRHQQATCFLLEYKKLPCTGHNRHSLRMPAESPVKIGWPWGRQLPVLASPEFQRPP